MAPRETENNAYAKFWGDKQRALWYGMVFLEWSIGRYLREGGGSGGGSHLSGELYIYCIAKNLTTG